MLVPTEPRKKNLETKGLSILKWSFLVIAECSNKMIVTAAVKSVEALSLCRGPPRRSAVAHRMIGKLPTRAHVEVEGRSGGGGTRLTVTSTRAHPHIPFSDYPVVPNKCELS